MNNRYSRYLVFFITLTSPFHSAFAEWNAKFYPPSTGQDILTITLPDETTTPLAVELDNIDITELIVQNGNSLNYRPVEALIAGQHTLRLIALLPDGSIIEKSIWSFITQGPAEQAIQAEAWLKSASFKAETLTEFSNRLKSRNIGANAPHHTIASGSGQAYGQAHGDNWVVNAEGNYLLQSDKSLRQTSAPLDIGEYTLSAAHQGQLANTQLTVGHHDTGIDSLLIAQFYRRGMSAQIASKQDRISANAFAFNAENVIGSDNISGISDQNNRLNGFSARVKPFSSDQDALTLTTMYYDGERTQEGFGIGSVDETATGSGWGIAAEKQWLNNQLKFQSHYARSQFDLDGKQGLAPEDDSNAFTVLLEANPFNQTSILGQSLNLTIGSQYERIDTFFQSLANQGLASDRDAVTLYSNLYWENLSIDLQLSRETNNVDDLIGLPTDELQQFTWNSSYIFTPSNEPNHWLGSPYINFSGFTSQLDRDKTPTGYIGSDTDTRSNSYTISGGSNYETVYWTLSHTRGSFNDDTNTTNDTSNDLSSFDFGWQAAYDILLTGNLQYATFKDKDNGDNSYDTQMGLGLVTELIPKKLNLDLNYNLNRSAGATDLPNRHILNTELGWTFRQATYNRPGFSLALRGSLEKTNGNATFFNNETSYQLFAIFRINAPFSGQY
jgi:hypothetical protein